MVERMAQSLPATFRSLDLTGFDVSTLEFEKPLEKRLTCPIGQHVLEKPMQLSCGHHVCQKCLDKVFQNNDSATCPVDVDEDCKNIKKNEVFPDNSVAREVLKLMVKCPNTKYGCNHVSRLSKLQDHINSCQYQSVTCPQCNQDVAKKLFQKHQSECEYVPVKCTHCKIDIPKIKLEAHLKEECPEYIVPCSYKCDAKPMKRKDLASHYARCSNKPDECGFKFFECNFEGTSEEIEEHMKREIDKHLKLVAVYTSTRDSDPSALQQRTSNVSDDVKSRIMNNEKDLKDLKLKVVAQAEKLITLDRKVSELPNKSVLEEQGRLTRDLKEKVNNLTLQIKNMDGGAAITQYGTINAMADAFSSQLSAHDRQLGNHDVRIAEMDLRFQIMETASYNGVIIWKIKDYYRRKQDAINGRTLSLYSQPFYTSKYGYKMCIRTYLNGDGMGKNTHLSLFFVVMGGEFDSLLPWPFQQKVTLYIVDQSREGRHLSDHFHPDVTSSSFRRPTSEMNVASGCPLFVSHSVLENRSNSYLKDDTLFIRCNVDTAGLANF